MRNIFGPVRQFLESKGFTEARARRILGKWRKTNGDAEVIAAVTAAQTKSVSEPMAWITAALRAKKQPRREGVTGLGPCPRPPPRHPRVRHQSVERSRVAPTTGHDLDGVRLPVVEQAEAVCVRPWDLHLARSPPVENLF